MDSEISRKIKKYMQILLGLCKSKNIYEKSLIIEDYYVTFRFIETMKLRKSKLRDEGIGEVTIKSFEK